jgi:hypothetical protein
MRGPFSLLCVGLGGTYFEDKFKFWASNQARLRAELKHITKHRKRKKH